MEILLFILMLFFVIAVVGMQYLARLGRHEQVLATLQTRYGATICQHGWLPHALFQHLKHPVEVDVLDSHDTLLVQVVTTVPDPTLGFRIRPEDWTTKLARYAQGCRCPIVDVACLRGKLQIEVDDPERMTALLDVPAVQALAALAPRLKEARLQGGRLTILAFSGMPCEKIVEHAMTLHESLLGRSMEGMKFMDPSDRIKNVGAARSKTRRPFPSLTASLQLKEAICPVCGEALHDRLNYAVVYCPSCSTPHHSECWRYVDGCAIYGCCSDVSHGAGMTRSIRNS